MPLQKLTLKSGVNRENTRYTNEGGWYESNLVRFRQGTPEKIGGWQRISANTFLGTCRSLWNWVTLAGRNLLGVGTEQKFYIENGGTYYDITPIRAAVTLTNPFTTVSGSKTVTVADAAGGYKNGDYVTYYGSSAVGGLTLLGQYQISAAVGALTYTIQSATNASSSATGGGTVYAVYQVNTGVANVVATVGWGSGGWGSAAWGADGVGTGTTTLLVWNQTNFGQDLLVGQRGGPLYYWSAGIGISPSAVGLTIASPCVMTGQVVGNLVEGQSVTFTTTGALPTGLLPGVTYYVKNWTSTSCNLAATGGGGAINTSGTQTGTHSVAPNALPLTTLNGISASPPLYQNYFLVSDASRFVLLFGTNDVGSTALDPLLIRWADQASLTQWYPAVTNQAGSIRLSHGSKIVTAIQSRQEILTFTDQSLHSLQYVGPPYVWQQQLLADNISIVSPYAAAVASGVTYWMGADKFYMYDGRASTLECDLRQYIYDDFNFAQAEQFFAGTNEGFNEVWWFYVSENSTSVDRYVVYNYVEKVWYYGNLARTAWLDSGLRQYPVAATYLSNIVNHEAGTDDTSTGTPTAMDSYITSSEFDIGDGDHFAFIWRLLPDITFRGSTTGPGYPAPQVTFQLQPLANSGSGYNVPKSVAGPNSNATAGITGTVPVTSVDVDQYTGQVNIRVRGRQMSIKVMCNTLGTQWQLGSPRIDTRMDGRR